MGVHGLWTLLEPVGRRLDIQAVSNKRLAVDASIWLYQFIRAMRTPDGEMMKNAHLLGFFRRICKLLFHKVQPIFVFEGTVPALKRQTIAARHARRETHSASLKRAAEKLVINHIKRQALLEAQRQRQQKRQLQQKQDQQRDQQEVDTQEGPVPRPTKRRRQQNSSSAPSNDSPSGQDAATGPSNTRGRLSAAQASTQKDPACAGASQSAAVAAGSSSHSQDLSTMTNAQLEELQMSVALEASKAAAADPKGKRPLDQRTSELQDRIQRELQQRAGVAGGLARQDTGGDQAAAAAAGGTRHQPNLTVDEQLARELDEALNRPGKRNLGRQPDDSGARLFNFSRGAAPAGGDEDGEDALLAAALAQLDAEDAAAESEALLVQAAAVGSVGGVDSSPVPSQEGDAGLVCQSDAQEAEQGGEEGVLRWRRQSRRQPARAARSKQQQLDEGPTSSNSESDISMTSSENSDSEKEQQQEEGQRRRTTRRGKKHLTTAQQQQQKVLGALSRHTTRRQQQQQLSKPSTTATRPKAAAAAGDSDWEPDDQAEEDAAVLGFKGRVGVSAGDELSDSADDAGELLLPADVSNLDPAVLSTLPQSVQLDILEKMRDAQQTANREKFLEAATTAPKNFSSVQMEAYLKASRFRQTIEQYKRAIGGGSVNGATPAGQPLQGRKLASEHTREFIFARQSQQSQPQGQAASTTAASGGFMPDPMLSSQQYPGHRGPVSPGSRPKRRKKVDALLEEMREAERKNPGAGFKMGVVPKGGVEGLKGLAAFTSVLKTWTAAAAEEEDQQQQQQQQTSSSASQVKKESQAANCAAPVAVQPGSAGPATSAPAVKLEHVDKPQLDTLLPSAAARVQGPSAGAMVTEQPDKLSLQLQLPLEASTVDAGVFAADADLFSGLDLSSSSEGEQHEQDPAALSSRAAAVPAHAAVVAAAAADGDVSGHAASGGDLSEDWEEVDPAQLLLDPSGAHSLKESPPDQEQQQQEQQQQEQQQEQQQQEQKDQLPGWRQRMALRHKFWSTSHGFKLGRKLGDWAAAEADSGPAGAAAGGEAGPAGVVAAVIGGALGRSPVKAKVGRGDRQLLGPELVAVLGSDEEADADVQAAIQMSLAEVDQTTAGVATCEESKNTAAPHAAAAATAAVEDPDDVVYVSDDWEEVEVVPAAAAGDKQPAAAQQTALEEHQQQQQQQQQTSAADVQVSSAQQAGPVLPEQHSPLQQQPPREPPDSPPCPPRGHSGLANTHAAASPEQTPGQPTSKAASLASLYNSQSKVLLEQHPAVAPSRPRDIASIRQNLLAASDIAAAGAEAREYPSAAQLMQQTQQVQFPEESPQQQSRPQAAQQQQQGVTAAEQQSSAPGHSRLPSDVLARHSPGLCTTEKLQPITTDRTDLSVTESADFSFLDQEPSLHPSSTLGAPSTQHPHKPAAVSASEPQHPGGPGSGSSKPLTSRRTAPKQQQRQQRQQQPQASASNKQPGGRLLQDAPCMQQDAAARSHLKAPQLGTASTYPAAQTLQSQQQLLQLSPRRHAQEDGISCLQQSLEGTGGAGDRQQQTSEVIRQQVNEQQQQQQQEEAWQPSAKPHAEVQTQHQPAQQQQQQLEQASIQQEPPEAEQHEQQQQQPRALVDIDAELEHLAAESAELRSHLTSAARNTATPTQDMVAECQELLTLFGLPFVTAPAEAEAQCAWLEAAGLVDGVVTDDNDAFLFGAQHIYRHMFEDRKYVEEYHMSDIERELGVDRGRLVCLALLLGSDYTEGVGGIGVVNALEVVSAWPNGLSDLAGFKQWLESPDERILAAATAALRNAEPQHSRRQQQPAPKGRQAKGSKNKAKAKGTSGDSKETAARTATPRVKGKGRAVKHSRRVAAASCSDEETAGQQPDAVPSDACGEPADAQAPAGEQLISGHQGHVAEADVPARTRFKATHRGVARSWQLPANFPNPRVHDAYIQPLVDRNPAKFSFGKPHADRLQHFCRDYFGWDEVKAKELLRPVLSAYAERTTQLRIDQFLTHKQRFAKIRSKRLQEAVTAIVAATGSDVNPELFYASTEHLPDLRPADGVLAKEPLPSATNHAVD